ncbi:MAG: amidohydrolase family protein [Planctomycetota bacterium]|nr:amidohydrolase family protein [Planctomycetota bacterium]
MTDTRKPLKEFIEHLPFIDTHSHTAGFDLGTPLDDKAGKSLPQVIENDYLLYLSSSCVVPARPPVPEGWRVEDAEEHFQSLLPLLDACRGLSTYAALREGIRELFPFDGEDITTENWKAINEQVVATYRKHGERAWHRNVCRKAGIIRQNQMCVLNYVTDHWDALPEAERAEQKQLLLPSLVLDGYLFTGFASGPVGRERTKQLLEIHPRTRTEYLAMCGDALDLFKEKGGSTVKLLTAYHRTLKFEMVSDEEADALFAKGVESLEAADLHRLQDNLCRHLLRMANQRALPLQVHTGYSLPSQWADPEHLLYLFRDPDLQGLKIDLCHSGWPHEGGGMILARTYRGCYFNLCWTPLLSPTLARRILSEAIDIVPMNKILIGTDCGTPEMMLGATWLIRRVILEVLDQKVAEGQFNLAVARAIAKSILFGNACEFFGLSDDLKAGGDFRA